VSIRVRRAEPDDAEAIGQIRIRGWQFAYRGLLPDHVLDALSDDERLAARRDRLRSPSVGSDAWIAELDGRVVGFALCGPSRDQGVEPRTGELLAIYVEPDVVGRGVGRGLIEQAERGMWAAGYRRAMLWVLRDNARARRFYEHAGWRADGRAQEEELDGACLREVRYVRERPAAFSDATDGGDSAGMTASKPGTAGS
jgi:GNAT superfamily N-acetyltransferase